MLVLCLVITRLLLAGAAPGLPLEADAPYEEREASLLIVVEPDVFTRRFNGTL